MGAFFPEVFAKLILWIVNINLYTGQCRKENTLKVGVTCYFPTLLQPQWYSL
jgi:hypothetical protein